MLGDKAATLLDGVLSTLQSKIISVSFKNNPQIFLILITLFVSSCNFSNIDISLSGSRIFSQSLKTTQMEEITGGIVNQPIENGIYSCGVSYSSHTSLSCDSLNNFVFNQSSGTFNWVPDYQQEGTYRFEIVSPKGKKSVVVIEVAKKNEAPVLSVEAIVGSIMENGSYAIEFDASDVNLDPLTYSYECRSGNCAQLQNIRINSVTKEFLFDTNFSSAGSYSFALKATDGKLESSVLINFNVLNVNRAPIVTAQDDVSILENQTWFSAIMATDPDGETLSFSCVTCPTGLIVNSSTGVMNWQPSWLQSGAHSVEIGVSDGNLSSSATFTIYVGDVNRAPVLSAVGNRTVNENSLLSFSLAATDADGDSLTYSCGASCPAGMTISGSVVSWTPTYTQSGSYTVTFSVSDGALSDNETISITVNNVNRAPVLATVGDKAVNENALLSFTLSATDPDGDSLTYSCGATCPSGMTISGSTVNWTPTYAQSGSYSVTFTTSDGSLTDTETISITVNNVNRAPVLAAVGDKAVNENALLSFTLSATDPDGDSLTYSCGATCPSGMTISGSTVSWTPTYAQSGSYSVTFTTSDGSLTDTESITISVTDINQAPTLAAVGDKSVNENTLLSFNLSATDPDGDSLTYSCGATCPSGMTISGSTVSWTPTYAQSGSYSVTFTTSDGSLSDSETISITVNNVNRAPVLATVGDKTINENALLSFTLSATDPDGDSLTYSCGATCPSGMTISGSIVSWTPTYAQSGSYSVTFTTSDGSLTDTETISITVNNVNRAPVMDTIADRTVQEGSLLSIALVATDPDGDTLTYSCGATCPTGMTINNSTATVSWVPDYDQSGSYSVTMVVSDGSLNDSKTFAITVTNRNRAPTLDTIANQIVNENSLLTFGLSGSDPDGDTLTYSCYTCPTGMTVTGTVVNWTPTYTQNGTYTVVVRVTDGSLSASQTLTVSVNNVNRAPTLAAIGNKTVNEEDLLSFNLSGTDADGDALAYSCIANCPNGLSISGNTVSWTPTYLQSGIYTSVTFRVRDGSLSASEAITITVNNVNRAPNLASVSNQTVNENSPITSIDLNDLGDDFDVDGDPITYACEYGLGLGSTTLGGVNCSGLSGFNFSALTGIITWTPAYDQSGIYEFEVTGTDGDLSNSRVFTITVNNVNRAPVLAAIGNKTVNENTLLTFTLAATDADGDTLTYLCSANCPSGMTVSGSTVSWTPTYSDAGTYLSVTFAVSDGSLSDSEAITITVNNVNRAPVLASILNRSAKELMAISTINANDGGDDFDVDGDAITYSCNYDNVVDGSVGSSNPCTNLTDLAFNSSTGVLNWVPVLGSAGTYEFKIEGSDGSLSGSQVFTVTITPSYPLIMTYRTATASESISLPMTGGGSYNFKVDWGDSSALQTVTTDTVVTHTYASAGDYVVKIHGTFSRIYAHGLAAAERNKIIEVNDLGRVGLNNLNAAFSNCQKLVSFNSGNGDTSAVTTMGMMFSGNTSLTSVIFGTGFSTANVITMNAMFSGANKLTTIDVSGFNTAKVKDMSMMFYNTTLLNSITFSPAFNTSAVTDMSSMFGKTTALASLDLSGFNTAAVTDMSGMFSEAKSLTTLDLSNFNTANVTTMAYMFSEAIAITTLNLSKFNTSKVTSIRAMFNKMTSLTDVNISSFDTSNVTNMGFVFADLPNLESLDVTHFKTAKVTDMAAMFQNIPKLEILDVGNFNTANVTQMYQMFYKLSGLTELDLLNFDTSKVTNMRNMFSEASSLEVLDLSSFNTSSVTDMSYMFYHNFSLTSLNISSFNTANVIDMNNMFNSMTSLTTLSVSNFNTVKVQNMSSMFSDLTQITNLNLSNFNTAAVTNMSYMFYNTPALATLNLSNFNTAAVTTMANMFYNTGLTSLTFPSTFTTTNVTTMLSMFRGAKNLTSLDLSNFNVSNVTEMSQLFYGATNLASINLADWTLRSPLPARTSMFTNTPAGKTVYCEQDPIGNALSVTCTAY